MIDFTAGNKRRDVGGSNYGTEIAKAIGKQIIVPTVVELYRSERFEINREFPAHPGPNRVCSVGAFFMTAHGDDAAGIDSNIRDADPIRHAGVVSRGNKYGIVVRDDASGSRGQPVEKIVRIAAARLEVEEVSRADTLHRLRCAGHAFENEAVQTIVGRFIRKSEALIDKQRQAVLIGDIGRMRQSVVRLGAPVHLRPVENVIRVFSLPPGVQHANSFALNGHRPIVTK